MATVVTKATLLKVTISASLTSVVQITELSIGGQQQETFSIKTLDGGAAVGKKSTGYYEQGNITGRYFYDPANATHQFIAASSQTPLTTDVACAIVMTDTDSTSLTFNAAAIGLGETSFDTGNGVMQAFEIVPNGGVAFPTS